MASAVSPFFFGCSQNVVKPPDSPEVSELGGVNSGNSNLENGTTYWGPVTEKPDQFSILNDGSLNQDGFQ
jgi:hypothetical protein